MKLTSLGAKVQIVQISSNVEVQYFGRVKKNSFFRRFEVMTDFCNISFVPKAQIVQIRSNVAVQYFGRVKKNYFFRRFEVMADFCNI